MSEDQGHKWGGVPDSGVGDTWEDYCYYGSLLGISMIETDIQKGAATEKDLIALHNFKQYVESRKD